MPVRKAKERPKELNNINLLMHIYNDYRTFLLNEKYYGHKLNLYENYIFIIDMVSFVGTSASIGGLSYLKGGVGSRIYSIVGVIALILSACRRIGKFPSLIARYTRLKKSYAQMTEEIRQVVRDISVHSALTEKNFECYQRLQERFLKLTVDDDAKPSKRLRERLQAEINREIPADTFWMPPEESSEIKDLQHG